MINIFLRMIYNDNIDNLYTSNYNIAGSGSKVKIEHIQKSDHHIIINPTGTNFDRYLVHEVIKRYAGTNTLEFVQNPNSKFRTIQISDLDKLTHNAQTSLRRMIEVNSSKCRFIMWCDNLSNVIGPLKSRCVCIRVPRPPKSELFAYLVYTALKKRFDPQMDKLIEIVDYSECNIKTALWCLEFYMKGYDYITNYDVAIDNIVNLILQLDIANIEKIRDVIFNILITNYTAVDILRSIENKLIKCPLLNDECRINIILKASEVSYNMIRGRRDIIHFDAFITEIMNIIGKSKQKNINKKSIKQIKY
jgi:replication factor C subunit 3/5